MENTKKEYNWKKDLITTILLISILTFTYAILTYTIEAESNIQCNTGRIGINYEAEYNTQNQTCKYEENTTCFKQDLINKKIELKGIEDMNCQINFKGQIPWWIMG